MTITDQMIRELNTWIDHSPANAQRDPEAQLWGRVSKVTEEAGEVISALIGYTGQNPRKGVTNTLHDVELELLDVALTALCALEHTRQEGDPTPLEQLTAHVSAVHARALGVELHRGSTYETDSQFGYEVDRQFGEQFHIWAYQNGLRLSRVEPFNEDTQEFVAYVNLNKLKLGILALLRRSGGLTCMTQ